jgi:uncharacterized membrane-anchored protein YjiN (DUF445 family)
MWCKDNSFHYALGANMFSSNHELYNYVEALISKLDEENEEKWSKRFEDALRISSLPGEILGELLKTMRDFRCTEIPNKIKINKEIDRIIIMLEKTLNH